MPITNSISINEGLEVDLSVKIEILTLTTSVQIYLLLGLRALDGGVVVETFILAREYSGLFVIWDGD